MSSERKAKDGGLLIAGTEFAEDAVKFCCCIGQVPLPFDSHIDVEIPAAGVGLGGVKVLDGSGTFAPVDALVNGNEMIGMGEVVSVGLFFIGGPGLAS